MESTFGLSLTTMPGPVPQRLRPMFSLKVLKLSLCSLLSYFLHSVRLKARLCFVVVVFACGYPVDSGLLVESPFFLHGITSASLSEIVSACLRGSISGLSVLFHRPVCLSLFYFCPYCPHDHHCGCVVTFSVK